MDEKLLTPKDIAEMYEELDAGLYSICLKNLTCMPLPFTDVRFFSRTADRLNYYLQEFLETKIDFEDAALKCAIDRLNDCLSQENISRLEKLQHKDAMSEKDLQIAIALHLVQKLCGSAMVSKSKEKLKCPCGCDGKLESAPMFIGSKETWHGELDIVSGNQATNIRVSLETTEREKRTLSETSEDGSSPTENSQVNHTNLKAREGSGFCQVIAQAIVFGWTEYNRHKELSAYIPSVMIDDEKFLILIYNPVLDSFFISNGRIPYADKKKIDSYGIFALWIVLNHRIFFRKKSRVGTEPSCGFQSNTKEYIEHYRSLDSYSPTIHILASAFTEFAILSTAHIRKKKPRTE